ncbi:MAG: hypothetical protein WD278_13065, partial [Pirellulales bacterium]
MNIALVRRGWPACWARCLLAPLVLASLALLPAGEAAAAEQYERFLSGLRERRLYDMALEYLESMRASPLVTSEQRQTMPYEEGRILVESAREEREMAARTKLLDRARDRFQEFIQANSAHPLSASAEAQLGQVLVERARGLIFQSQRPVNAARQDAMVNQARALLTEAQAVFTAAEQKFEARLNQYPKFIDPKQAQQIEEREQARMDLIQARLLAGGVVYEIAKTQPAGSEEAKKQLQAAADKFGSIYEKYRNRLAGLLARVKQGQCYQDMGDTKRALGFYSEILSQPEELDEFRKLKATALHLTLQCLTSDQEKKHEEAIARGKEWLAGARGAEERYPDWLAVRYYLALAQKSHADALDPKETAKRKSALAEARKHANFVGKHAGEYREAARKLFQQLAGLDDEAVQEPATFADARDRGQEALDVSQALLAKIRMAPAVNDQASVPAYEQQMHQARERAENLLRLALELRDETTPIEDVNLVRYYLAFLAYHSGDIYDAPELGGFVATKYPSGPAARQAAKIAMASYAESYRTSPADQRDFDREQMVEIAEFITRRWPSEVEADEAWTLLMSIAVNEHQLDKALEYLGHIAADSPRRGEAELKAGQALWGAYLEAARQEAEARAPQAEIDQIKSRARETLAGGIQRMRAAVDSGQGQVDATLAAAMLSLGQIEVDSGQPAEALELLNDPKVGPMTLLVNKSPAVAEGNFAVETYKLALRAYVATEALDKAEATMNELESAVGATGDTSAASLLTRTYIRLGQELEQQVSRLRQENKAEELAKVTKGFELFLERISSRETGNTFRSLNWVAETFFSLGSGYDAGGQQVSDEAKAYYEKAYDTDQKILSAAEADSRFAPGDALLAVRLRMARTQRRLGEFLKAVNLLVSVLQEKPQLIDAQREAARTYQEWGRKKAGYYGLA